MAPGLVMSDKFLRDLGRLLALSLTARDYARGAKSRIQGMGVFQTLALRLPLRAEIGRAHV